MSETPALTTLFDCYFAAREAYDSAKKASDEADKLRREAEKKVVDYMIENGITKVSLADGVTPLLANTVTISVTQESYEDIRAWLRASVGDDKDFLVTIPHKPAILELVKQRIDEGVDTSELPAFLKVSTRPTLRVMGWKGRE